MHEQSCRSQWLLMILVGSIACLAYALQNLNDFSEVANVEDGQD